MSSKCAPIRHLEVRFGIPTASWGVPGGAQGSQEVQRPSLGSSRMLPERQAMATSCQKYCKIRYDLDVRKNATKKLNISTKMRTSSSHRNSPYLSDVRAASGAPGGGQKGPSGRPLGTLWAPLRRLLGAQNAIKIHAPFRSLSEPSFGHPRVGRRRLRYCFYQSESMSHESPQVGRRVPKVSSNWLLWEVPWGPKRALKEARWRVVKWTGI